jgi:hypothetical protein
MWGFFGLRSRKPIERTLRDFICREGFEAALVLGIL